MFLQSASVRWYDFSYGSLSGGGSGFTCSAAAGVAFANSRLRGSSFGRKSVGVINGVGADEGGL